MTRIDRIKEHLGRHGAMTDDNGLAAVALREHSDYCGKAFDDSGGTHSEACDEANLSLDLASALESGKKRVVDATGHDTEALVKKCFEQECRIGDLEKQLTLADELVEQCEENGHESTCSFLDSHILDMHDCDCLIGVKAAAYRAARRDAYSGEEEAMQEVHDEINEHEKEEEE